MSFVGRFIFGGGCHFIKSQQCELKKHVHNKIISLFFIIEEMIKKTFIIILGVFSLLYGSNDQTPGDDPPRYNPDTVFVFQSPRPLIIQEELLESKMNSWGIDLMFSESGFGVGAYMQKNFSRDFGIFGNFLISGARNRDEFEQYICNIETNECEWKVWNKVNRLYIIPITLGAQYNLFGDELSDSFRPFVSAGLGVSFVASLPYDREFFSSFKYSSAYTRFASFAGVGANFSITGKTIFTLNIRYYYIPFGGDGLESIKNSPIHTFGGLFLSMSFGIRY